MQAKIREQLKGLGYFMKMNCLGREWWCENTGYPCNTNQNKPDKCESQEKKKKKKKLSQTGLEAGHMHTCGQEGQEDIWPKHEKTNFATRMSATVLLPLCNSNVEASLSRLPSCVAQNQSASSQPAQN